MAEHGDVDLDEFLDRRGDFHPALDLDGVRAAFLHEASGVAHRFLKIDLVAEIRHVRHEQSARHPALDRLRVMQDLIDGDRQGALVAELGHADRVTDEDHVDPGLFGEPGGGEIVRRQHRDLDALALHVQQGGDRDGFGGDDGRLIGHDARV